MSVSKFPTSAEVEAFRESKVNPILPTEILKKGGTPVEIGEVVIYTDPKQRKHKALVTANWGHPLSDSKPSLNLVYVDDDETKTDPYGRQLAQRPTSIPHRSNQAAPGNYWEEV